MQTALEILQKYWKHDNFRSLQNEIIDSVLSGKDTFALMPTGGGKSICFQIPAMMNPGICLVISPLVALMKDQVANLQSKGIKAIALTGGIKSDEIIDLLDNCQFGDYKFLYLSPERLESDWILDRIKNLPINLIAIDEAHCVSQSCLDVSSQLKSLGFQSTYYHGGLSPKEKDTNMQLWMQEKAQVIVATNAFGMGIDKPNVKTVIHIQLPENIENYYQEAGRAGRNGEKAFSVILTNSSKASTNNSILT